jgi:hypothetical protein
MGVEEVAFRLGYSDLTGFLRAFRRNAGRRPGEYRRLCRSDGAAALGKTPAQRDSATFGIPSGKTAITSTSSTASEL